LRAGPCIYIPQEQGGPVIPPGTGCTHTHTHTHTHTPVTLLSSVLTVCLTTLLQWLSLTRSQLTACSRSLYNHFARTEQKTPFLTVTIVQTYLPIRCLETGCVTPLFIRLLYCNDCISYNTYSYILKAQFKEGSFADDTFSSVQSIHVSWTTAEYKEPECITKMQFFYDLTKQQRSTPTIRNYHRNQVQCSFFRRLISVRWFLNLIIAIANLILHTSCYSFSFCAHSVTPSSRNQTYRARSSTEIYLNAVLQPCWGKH
jgi:hypothetical protein